jgi:hypothetical protein
MSPLVHLYLVLVCAVWALAFTIAVRNLPLGSGASGLPGGDAPEGRQGGRRVLAGR